MQKPEKKSWKKKVLIGLGLLAVKIASIYAIAAYASEKVFDVRDTGTDSDVKMIVLTGPAAEEMLKHMDRPEEGRNVHCRNAGTDASPHYECVMYLDRDGTLSAKP